MLEELGRRNVGVKSPFRSLTGDDRPDYRSYPDTRTVVCYFNLILTGQPKAVSYTDVWSNTAIEILRYRGSRAPAAFLHWFCCRKLAVQTRFAPGDRSPAWEIHWQQQTTRSDSQANVC